MNDKGLPKYMHSVVTGTQNDGVYIIHNQEPKCVGKIIIDKSRVTVEMWRSEGLTEEEIAKQEKEMERWYFYKYVK